MRLSHRCLGFAAFLLFGCASSQTRTGGSPGAGNAVLDFYPLLPGWGWAYEIEREGTPVLALYSVAEGRADLVVVKHGEERIEYALLPDGIARREYGRPGDYVLKSPLRAGASWPVSEGMATVAEVGKTVTLPSGAYRDCAVVEEVRRDPNRVTRTTYCRDTGPVEIEMRVFSPLKQTYESLAHARLMSVSRPEAAAAK
jgi:hypothetical protein